jgi:hypothetical protein
MQKRQLNRWEFEQQDTATSGQNGFHIDRAGQAQELSHLGTSFSGPDCASCGAQLANGSDSGSNEPGLANMEATVGGRSMRHRDGQQAGDDG